eukprot:8385232-Karenia_brevis.AAC.1
MQTWMNPLAADVRIEIIDQPQHLKVHLRLKGKGKGKGGGHMTAPAPDSHFSQSQSLFKMHMYAC